MPGVITEAHPRQKVHCNEYHSSGAGRDASCFCEHTGRQCTLYPMLVQLCTQAKNRLLILGLVRQIDKLEFTERVRLVATMTVQLHAVNLCI